MIENGGKLLKILITHTRIFTSEKEPMLNWRCYKEERKTKANLDITIRNELMLCDSWEGIALNQHNGDT